MITGAIVGATASGKSSLGIELAKQNGLEIVSVDSRQVFRGFRVGTGQVSSAEMEGVPHHFMDFLDADGQFSAGDFLKALEKLDKENPDKKFLLVGGTGFYVQAALKGIAKIPECLPEIRAQVQERLEQDGLEKLFAELPQIDALAAQRLHPNDTRRITRVHEVFLQTARPWSDFANDLYTPFKPFPVVWLNPERSLLYDNINRRVELMLDSGWAEEVEDLLKEGISPQSRAFQSLGYPEIQQLLLGKIGKNEFLEVVRQQTRRYAKRQLTWFRNQIPGIVAVESANSEKIAKTLSFTSSFA